MNELQDWQVTAVRDAMEGKTGEGRAILTVNVLRNWSEESRLALARKIAPQLLTREEAAELVSEVLRRNGWPTEGRLGVASLESWHKAFDVPAQGSQHENKENKDA